MTSRPRCMSSRQSAGGGSRSTIVARLPAIDLIGASELFISWPMTRISRCQAWRSSSRSGWLRSESTSSSCGRPPWRNWLRRISQRPTPPGNAVLMTRGASPARQSARPISSASRPSSRSAGWSSSRAPARLTNFSSCVLVEGEHRDVDLRHHLAQQRRRFERVEPLVAQRLDQRVDLDHDLAERIAAARAARADGEVPLAERGEQVRQRLQRQHHPLAQREREAEADGDDDDRERPLHLGGVVAGPEEDQRDQRAGQRRRQRHQQDAPVVAQARFAGGWHGDRIMNGTRDTGHGEDGSSRVRLSAFAYSP